MKKIMKFGILKESGCQYPENEFSFSKTAAATYLEVQPGTFLLPIVASKKKHCKNL